MAMMQSFRNSAKLIAVVLGVLMLIFVIQLSGLFDGGPNIFTQTSAGSINGRSVDARTYETLVQQQVDQQQRQNPGRLTLEDVESIRNRVWDQFIEAQVLEDEYKKYGVSVSDDEVVAALRTEPPPEVRQVPDFQTDGRFDVQKYQRWLTSPASAQIVEALGAQYREQIRRAKLYARVSSDVLPSDAALWERYKDQHDRVKIELTAIIPRNVVPDSAVTVAPAAIEAYYKAHPQEFARPKTAYLSYIRAIRLPDAADTAAARVRALELKTEIEAGAPFAEVARRESLDTASADKGGDLGEFPRGQMVQAFDQAAFSLPLNKVSDPVLSEFGYHLIEVTSRSGDKAKARHILVPIEPTGAHRQRLDQEADSLDRLAAEPRDGKTFAEVARSLGVEYGRTSPVQEGTRALVGNLVIPDAGVWAFRAKPGDVSQIIETPEALYVFRLDSVQAGETPKLEHIRGTVEIAVRDEAKWEKARELARQLIARTDAGESLADASKAMGFAHREFGPFARVEPPLTNPQVVGAAFGLKEGERSGVIDTKEGLYVIRVLKREPAERAKFSEDLDKDRVQLMRVARTERVRSYMDELRRKATIKDNREELRQAAQNQPAQVPQPIL